MMPHRVARSITPLLFPLIAALALSACGDPPPDLRAPHAGHTHEEQAVPDDAELGDVDFQADCGTAVQADFDRALALMHHMMYARAREHFAGIHARAPDCAMAYWGEATTLFQPLWGTRPTRDELEHGWRRIRQAAEQVGNEREQVLVDATYAFFKDPGQREFRERLQGWIDGMATAYEAFPDDPDIATLQGLALLTEAQTAEHRHALYDLAEALLRQVWAAQPRHPGAIHYMIHATDADGRERNALDMVEAYADIAPETPHALHMPSHIYVRLGDWPQVIDWNERSARAALRHPVSGHVSHHYIHAMDYRLYAHLQRGEYDAARAVLDETLDQSPHQPSFIAAYHFAAMPARLAVERRDWAAAATIEPREPASMPWDASAWPEAMSWYARGLGALHSGDLATAREAHARMAELREQARADGERSMAVYIDVDYKILEGWIAWAMGDAEQAEILMRAAGELEATVDKHPVEPGSLQPAHEALGDLLMRLERPADALAAYRRSDAIWPERYNTLLGAAKAADAAGDTQASRDFSDRLLASVGDPDQVRPLLPYP